MAKNQKNGIMLYDAKQELKQSSVIAPAKIVVSQNGVVRYSEKADGLNLSMSFTLFSQLLFVALKAGLIDKINKNLPVDYKVTFGEDVYETSLPVKRVSKKDGTEVIVSYDIKKLSSAFKGLYWKYAGKLIEGKLREGYRLPLHISAANKIVSITDPVFNAPKKEKAIATSQIEELKPIVTA